MSSTAQAAASAASTKAGGTGRHLIQAYWPYSAAQHDHTQSCEGDRGLISDGFEWKLARFQVRQLKDPLSVEPAAGSSLLRMAVIGASRPLRRIPAKVPSPSDLPTFVIGYCPTAVRRSA